MELGFIYPNKDMLAKFDGQSIIKVSFLGQTGLVGQKVSMLDFAGLQDVSDPWDNSKLYIGQGQSY